MENIYVIQPTRHGRARALALLFACLIYLFLLAILIVELKPIFQQKYNELFPQSSGKLSQTPGLPPRTTPAPVRYMPRPPAPTTQQKQQAPSAPAQTQPQAQQTPPPLQPAQPQTTPPAQEPSAQAQKKQSEKELPKTERTIKKKQTTPTDEPRERSQQQEEIPEHIDASGPQFPRRRLREKCYKNGKIPEQTVTLNRAPQNTMNNSPSVGAQLAQGFADHMQQQNEYEGATALTSEHNTKGHESALEQQLFMHNFGMAFCNNSYNNPLKMTTSLIQPHRIELMITCNKQRKVTRVRFMKASYDNVINEYIKELLTTMMTPQIPACVVTNDITFPISIELERAYQSNTIYFVPGNSKRRGY